MTTRSWTSIIATLVTCCLSVAAPIHAQAMLRVTVGLSPAANLFYQLDCVGGVTPYCGRADYVALWSTAFLRTRADSAALEEWATLRRRYRASFTPIAATTNGRERAIDVNDRLRIASLQSTDVEDLLVRLEILLSPADWITARRLLLHFAPPFQAWWRGVETQGRTFAADMQRLLVSDSLQHLMARVVRFYGSQFPPEAGIPMQLMVRPNRAVANTSGQQLDRYSIVEFMANDRALSTIDVALHELCHFFFANRTTSRVVAHRQQFLASASPSAVAAMHLLDEGVAAAVGNAMVPRLLDSARFVRLWATPMGLYTNPDVDKTGRLLLPLVTNALQRGQSVDDTTFTRDYIDAVGRAFADAVTAPRLLLNQLYYFADRDVGPSVSNTILEAFRVSALYSARAGASDAPFEGRGDLSALVVVRPTSIPMLVRSAILSADEAAQLRRRLAAGGASYVTRRPGAPWTFVVVANTDSEAIRQIRELAGQSSVRPST